MDQDERSRVAVQHAEARDELEQIKERLSNHLRVTCDGLGSKTDLDFRFRWVGESRVKPFFRVVDALERLNLGAAHIWDIDDVVGARVVVVTKSDAKLLASTIEDDPSFPLKDLAAHEVNDDETGYRAIHIKGWQKSSFGKVGCEIQIRTMLEDAWAIVSRHDLYGRKGIPGSLRGIAIAESGHLAAAEESLERIRKGVTRAVPPFVRTRVIGEVWGPKPILRKRSRGKAAGSALSQRERAKESASVGPPGERREAQKPEVVRYFSCFISYGQPDADFAKKLQSDLRDAGVDSWLYELDKTVGKPVWREIQMELRHADKTVVVCSALALVRDGVRKEIGERIDDAPDVLIPISLDNLWTEPGFLVNVAGRDVKSYLMDRNYADFANKPYEEAFEELLKGLRRPRGKGSPRR
jgi:ppGpp synthetase/RelA/SpoT-type nucleotidyltranferase